VNPSVFSQVLGQIPACATNPLRKWECSHVYDIADLVMRVADYGFPPYTMSMSGTLVCTSRNCDICTRQVENNDCWMYSDMTMASSSVQELASGRKAIKSKFVRALMAGKSSSLPAAIYTALGCSYGALTQYSNLDANLRGPGGGKQAFLALARRGTHQ